MNKEIHVINLAGEREVFSKGKVERSAKRVGATDKVAREIADRIAKEVYEGIETKVIFERVKDLLREAEPKAAIRFNIKKAIRDLGPTGFPFEKFAGEIFAVQGYNIKYNQNVQGQCCDYEIDFIAENRSSIILAECKFRNDPQRKVDIGVALEHYARFLDIRAKGFGNGLEIRPMIITNEKFTSKAKTYALCAGLELLGWRYPKTKGFESFVDKGNLYPITILPSFERSMVGFFSQEKRMLVKDILGLDVEKSAGDSGISFSKLKQLKKEAKILLS